MLDTKIESFLCVCKHKSYTKASEELCLTQPAVTQHIQSLEKHYKCKMLEYKNKELKLTKSGELFYQYAVNLEGNENLIEKELKELNEKTNKLKFAATLTIGEFTIAPILGEFIKKFNKYNMTMYVDNTEKVLQMLKMGKIDFAIVEGLFNKNDYETTLYKIANFILIAPIDHPLVHKKNIFLNDLKNETIIVREKGSGSREVLERGLFDKNYTLKNFKNIIEIGNVNVMKRMVQDNLGLSFMYEDAAKAEIKKGALAKIEICDFTIQREFNFIHLKNHITKKDINKFFSFFLDRLV